MAETVVGFVIDKLLLLLTTEADLVSDLQDDLQSINNELRSIKVFLKDAEERAEENDAIREWVRQVRNIAHQIEDVIDEHMILHHCHDNPHHRGLKFLRKIGRYVVQLRPKHRIASCIKRIRSEILEVNQRRSFFGIDGNPSPSNGHVYEVTHQDPRAGFLYVNESELVGIEDTKRELIRLLSIDSKRDGHVIAVVGMGGLGKTTLVRKVYEDMSVMKMFPFRAWITVSRPGKTTEVMRNIIKQFYRCARDSVPLEIDTMDEELLVDQLRNYLLDQRFLVVFDDVWNLSSYIQDILPINGTGSRILMTTRLEKVALSWTSPFYAHIYRLQCLSPEKAWDLFCRKTFQGTEPNCPPELAKLSHEIVRKCEGLPLAIVTIGSLLSTKHKVATEWQKLCDSIGAELGFNSHFANIKKILLLSYYDLPHYLKPCFLYMGLFPEDCCIDRKRLIKLWIAEGFIPNMTGKTLEEVADEFLIELVHRSLVQMTWIDIAGRPRSFRVHDLLREIILIKSEELNFCQVLDKDNSLTSSQTRRFAILNITAMEFIKGSTKRSSTRSVFLFDRQCGALPESITGSFLKKFRLLKVLDLQDAPVNKIPEVAGSLFHLQYFSLRGTTVTKIPKSIGKLENLLTLDLKHTRVEELPIEMSKLCKLRHLMSYSYHWDDTFSFHTRNVTAVKVSATVCQNLLELQNLAWVDSNSFGLLEQIGNLKHLRRLGVAKLERKDGHTLCNSIKNMHHLQSFLVSSKTKDEVLDLDHMSSPPMLLRRVHLIGRLEKLPGWISQLENIVKMGLCQSNLKDDPFGVLGALPNLKMLVASEACDGETLHFGAKQFPKLKILRLFDLYNLKSLVFEPETLPVLEELELGSSPRMNKFPTGFQYLRNLILLTFHDMPRRISDSMAPNTGKHYEIISHVPNIYINSKAGAGEWESYSLRHPHDRQTLVYTPVSSPIKIR